ncbi:MAG: ORF6N domain-containing protein [Chitinophagaceae bacterium]
MLPINAQPEPKIYTIRGVQVMLDRDLAFFYGVKPIRLREQIKRNPNRFPSDFVFQLSQSEIDILVSQNAIPSIKSLGGSNPFVFTEHGVVAVSGVLKNDKAAEISIILVRAFVALKKTLLGLNPIIQRLDSLEVKQLKTDASLEKVFQALERDAVPVQGIFFEGQLFDAYVFVSQLIKQAKKNIVLFDHYVDENTLLLLSKRRKNVDCIIYAKSSTLLRKDLEKHNQQYTPIVWIEHQGSHDRFLILDDKQVYHMGASLKDLGKSCFAFNRMDDWLPDIKQKLMMG